MADLLTIEWKDSFGGTASSQIPVVEGYPVDDADILALVNAVRAASQAEITGYSLTLKGDIADLTGNTAAAATGSYDRTTDKAILQYKNAATGVLSRTSIPCPLDTVFETTGGYAQARVDMADSLIAAIATAAAGVWVSPGNNAVLPDKGWREGTKH
jgi:hypothetical protein